MGGKSAIVLGLLTGVVVGGLALAAVVAFAPVPGSPAAAAASPSPAAASPAPSAPADPGASADPAPGASSGASAAPGSPAEPSASTVAEAFGIGQPAPPLKLALVGGESVDLQDYRGKPVWVNFMATWCAPCRDELPLMAGYAARYEEAGLVVLAVDVKEDEAAAQAFFQDLNVYVPVALDTDGVAQAAWGAVALPVHFWVDKDGIVRDGALGGIGPDVMAKGLQSILPGVTVTP